MTIKRNRFALTFSLALIGFTATGALADEWNKETIFKFSTPVEVPGKVLEPGEYVFRLADNQGDRRIVQIFSKDEKGNQHFVTTILANPAYRMETPEKTMIQFEERAAGRPEAINKWFYPGDNYGWQFDYPKSERLEAKAPVTPPAPEPDPARPAAPFVRSLPVIPMAEPFAVVTEEEEVVLTEVALTPPPVEDNQGSADRLLPETAGQSGLLLIAGIAILFAGLATVSMPLFGSRA